MHLNTLPPGARFAAQNIDPTTGVALPDSLIRPYREYSFLTYLTNDATSNYHALQVQANRRYTQSFMMGLSYTLSKSFTTEPGAAQRDGACAYNPGTVTNANQSTTCFVNPYVPTKQWLGGPQYFDQTHVLVGNCQWTLPRASRLLPNPLVKGAFDNWELSGIYTFATGQPMSVTATSSVLGDISGSNILARPDCVAGVDPNSGPKTFAQWFNPAAFAVPAKGTFGNCGPNNFRGPGTNNWDMTLIKKIPLGETRSMRLRVEAYNVFNHTQFNATNVSKLVPAWSLQRRKEGVPFRLSQSIPLMVNGVLYLGWPYNHVAAIEPETGRILWEFTGNTKVRTTLGSMRSLAYWAGDRQTSPQILFGTEDGELYSLNAKIGKLNSDFGNEGIVNLKTPEIMNGFTNFQYGITSAPFIYKNLVITGAHVVDETGSKGPAGDVRAWDVRSGKLVWTFHTVPRPGEMGHETWLGDAWKKMSGANVWSFFSADAARGTLYLPLGSVNNDYYGVDRPGPNLFANSIVALDAETGRMKWYFQAVHHDLWDYDMPVPPMLFDVVRDGKRIPAVGAMTKNTLLFMFDRVTGEPLYPIDERPVPKGDVPGEWYSPTQPFPVKPPPLVRMSFKYPDDLAQVTPEHTAACRELLEKVGGGRNRGPFTPYSAEV